MDFFQAGGELGKANASPFSYGASNIFDRFNKAQDVAMQLQLQKGLFTGEHTWENQNDPQKVLAQKILDAKLGGGTSDAPGTASVPGSIAGGTSSGNPSTPNTGVMVLKNRQGLNSESTNVAVPAFEQQMKDRLEQDSSFNALNSMINTHFGALKTYHNAIGQGGILPSMTAKAATIGGDPYVAGATAQLHTANESLAQRIAREVNPSGIGRILSATRGQVGNPDLPETANVAANIQLMKDFYGLKKAYDTASISDPIAKNQIFNPDGTKKDFNNLSDSESAYLNSQKDKVITPEESAYFEKTGMEQYQNNPGTPVVNPRTGEVYSGPSRSAQTMSPFGKVIASIPGVNSFVGENSGFPNQNMNKLQIASERKQALASIAKGAPRDKVAQEFKNNTNEDL